MLTVTWAAFMMHQPTARRVVKTVRKRIRPSLPQQALHFGGEDDAANSSPPLLAARPDVTHAHILRSVEKEYARDLVGILYRRTGLGWYTQIPEKAVRETAELVAPTLGWNKDDIEREVESFAAYVRKYHLMSPTDWTA
jgi:glycerol-3-phosphate dehydrogenase